MRAILRYSAIAAAVLLMWGCSATRRVPQGQYLLTRNRIVEDREVPKKDRIKAADVERYIQLEPNRRFLGTNLYVHLHNMANPDTTNKRWFNRTLRNLGDAPVLLDSVVVERSADLVHNYVQYSGFYDSEVSFTVDTTRRKRARVTYTIRQNEPYRIGDISFNFQDELLRQVVMEDSSATLLRSGDILDGNVLSAEKERITRNLRNSGFYDFNQSYIEFFGDATPDPAVKDLAVEFRQKIVGYTPDREPVYDNTSIYRISKIIINPQFDPVRAADPDQYYARMDTLEYRGLYILYPHGGRPRVRAEILRQAVDLYPNYLYDEAQIRQTHSNIMRLGNYRSSDIIFEEVQSDQEMIITFVGDEDEETIGYTTEKYLKCHINCIPALRQGYKFELEGSTSSSFNAIRATVGYQNRNFFRGAELFEMSFTGGYEFLRSSDKKAAFEVGGAVSVSFPRFVTPFNIDRYNRAVNPRTKVEASVNTQNRRYYGRTLSGVTWGYSWSNRGRSSFALRPVDVNLVKMGHMDADYFDYLKEKNPYLARSFEDQLVGGISGSYVYNAGLGKGRGSFIFRLNAETAGNFLSLPVRLLTSKYRESSGEGYYRIFGIRYSQYFRVDASISDRVLLGPKTNIAFRVYGGLGKPYGNASAIPFDRLFYSGGSNSMRGWLPRRLGPGNEPVDPDEYPNQLGDMKLEANLELRFPVWKMLQGALFFDLGNIWNLKDRGQGPESVFKIDRFYRQLGFNTGIGARFDVNVAVIRFDFGYRLHDPNQPAGQRWTDKFKIGKTVINFGVGYPF